MYQMFFSDNGLAKMFFNNRSNHLPMFYKKAAVLKNFAIFIGKQLRCSLILIKK